MKEHPIIFSTDMVKAILDGRKTQTRRAIKPTKQTEWLLCGGWADDYIKDPGNYLVQHCPYGQVGDRLWVRETWQDYCPLWSGAWCGHGTKEGIIKEHQPVYKADKPELWLRNEQPPLKWRPSIHMPRWASRINLEITEIRAERLQEIRYLGIFLEGIPEQGGFEKNFKAFKRLWDSLNAKKYPWSSNPWVWVISFKETPLEEESNG